MIALLYHCVQSVIPNPSADSNALYHDVSSSMYGSDLMDDPNFTTTEVEFSLVSCDAFMNYF